MLRRQKHVLSQSTTLEKQGSKEIPRCENAEKRGKCGHENAENAENALTGFDVIGFS